MCSVYFFWFTILSIFDFTAGKSVLWGSVKLIYKTIQNICHVCQFIHFFISLFIASRLLVSWLKDIFHYCVLKMAFSIVQCNHIYRNCYHLSTTFSTFGIISSKMKHIISINILHMNQTWQFTFSFGILDANALYINKWLYHFVNYKTLECS